MTIHDVIREANSEHEVYFLLTAYVEAVRYGDLLSCLPAQARELPLKGMDDVRVRVDELKAGLDVAPAASEKSRVVVTETAEIFGEALNRLQWLQWEKRRARAMAA